MNPVQFTCDMCGESYNKVLPSTTNLTACHRCGNLIDISQLQKRNRRSNRVNNNYIFEFDEQDPYNLNENNYNFQNNNILDDDFYDFDRYESHDDYLPDPNRRNPRFNNNNSNNNNRRRGENRPFVRNGHRSNSMGGMFSIQIANDNYNRISAFNHRSNF